MQYVLSAPQANEQYLHIQLSFSVAGKKTTTVQLPSWRPGRYELGNFAKNVKAFTVLSKKGEKVPFRKTTKDRWEIDTCQQDEIIIQYQYFASELNAGSTYLDCHQLYVNPVNCLLYVVGKENETHTVSLHIPEQYRVVGALKHMDKHSFQFENFHQLADTPFIASANIQTIELMAHNIPFYIHFQGECTPDETKIKVHFLPFIEEIIHFFGEAPVQQYHFLIQATPYRFYHGVEHLESTVIALGPGYSLMHGDTWLDLLGVSCHELFHTWNIKTIRPAEMLPYDYTQENYAKTGYVYEGITTYYGDKLLFTSGVFSLQEYFQTLEERINKHFHNYGRFQLSLADSSWDTWLDGYVPGAPHRKVSIYDEGNLVAFMLDVLILEATENQKSLQHVMHELYYQFYKNGKGYQEQDIPSIVHYVSGKSFDDFFETYIYGKEEYEHLLHYCLQYLGISLKKFPSPLDSERKWGIKLTDGIIGKKVVQMAPSSPASTSGIQLNDEIVAIEDYHCKTDFQPWLHYQLQKNKTLNVLIYRQQQFKTLQIEISGKENFYPIFKLAASDDYQNHLAFQAWAKASGK